MPRQLALAFVLLALAASATAQTAKTPVASSTPVRPVAIIHTTAGDLKCTLFPEKAPLATANFIALANGTKDWKDPQTGKLVHGKPLYDGVIFHRVIPEFMIQGGDPSGTGAGDVGITFNDELSADLLFDRPGRLAMANRGPNTNSSQFFITEQETPFLNPCLQEGGCPEMRRPKGGYTIFGQCDDASVELVKKIARMPRGQGDRPDDPVKIVHIEVLHASKSAAVGKKTTHTAKAASKATPAK